MTIVLRNQHCESHIMQTLPHRDIDGDKLNSMRVVHEGLHR